MCQRVQFIYDHEGAYNIKRLGGRLGGGGHLEGRWLAFVVLARRRQNVR